MVYNSSTSLTKLNLIYEFFFKETGGFEEHTHQPLRKGGAWVSRTTDREAIGPFLLLPTILDLPDLAQKHPWKPNGAARGVHAPPPEWCVGAVHSTVVFTVGRSMWWRWWIQRRSTGKIDFSFFVEECGGFYIIYVFLDIDAGAPPWRHPEKTQVSRGAALGARFLWPPLGFFSFE